MRSKIVNVLLMSILLLGMIMVAVPVFASPDPHISIVPCPMELGDEVTHEDIICTYFDVAVIVEGIESPGIYGLDLQIGWDTTYIQYVDHETTIPVEDYPDPQTPSSYGGILHEGVMKMKDVVDETMTDPALDGSEPGTMMWLSYVSVSPAPEFVGDGTAVVIRFHVHDQPYDSVHPTGVDFSIEFKQTALSDKGPPPGPVSHTSEDCDIHLWPRLFEYKPEPKLSVLPDEIAGGANGSLFSVDIVLSDANHEDLSGFWDVAGFDFYVNFDPTLIAATAVVLDPDTWFAGDFPTTFWDDIFELIDVPLGGPREGYEINNVEGWVHIAFMGIGSHFPVAGIGRLAEITFEVIYVSETYPPPCAPIWLENPLPDDWLILHSLQGLIDLSSPVSTEWEQICPSPYFANYHLEAWEDTDVIDELDECDQVILRNLGTDKTADYHVEDILATLVLTQQPFQTVDDFVWTASFGMDNLANNGVPGRYVGTDDPYNGFGVPNWTGNFTTTFPVDSVNQIQATYYPFNFTGLETTVTLTENVDYKVHADEDLIELLVSQDQPIINEHWIDGVNNNLNGWPWIDCLASGIESVRVHFPNCTTRMAANNGYAMGPPGEWWYDPDWTWELEGWWALWLGGPLAGPWTWPAGTEWWINYTAASYLTIDYNADPDPRPYYVEYEGTYPDFLALGDPVTTQWHEIYPTYCPEYDLTDWVDSDMSGDISYCDFIELTDKDTGVVRWYHVEDVGTDIKLVKKPCVCEKDPLDEYYTWQRIVDIAGYPHPEREYCPWHNSDVSVPLPHFVNPAEYCAPFKLLGRNIDLRVCNYEEPWKGTGPNVPADAFQPQKTICLCAEVTYNLWPVQSKDVSFEIVSPHGDYVIVRCDRTDANGFACIEFGLPWPCDNPEDIIYGTWTVTATVDIMCTVINDTLTFEVGCLVRITDVTPDKPDYEIDDHMWFNISYTSISHQLRDALFYLTVYDDLGVPIGYMYTWVTDIEYGDGWVVLECLLVPKNTFVGQGTVYVNVLTDWPENGGIQYCTEYSFNIGLLVPS